MSRDYYKKYNKRSEKRRSKSRSRSENTSGWNITRILAAVCCFLGVIVLSTLAIYLAKSAEEEPDNVATRLSESPSPSPAPSASSVAPVSTPSPTPKHRKYAVALTFDDGPKSAEPDKGIKGTAALLDTLKQYDAHVTFFVVGKRCEIDADILKREVEEGHEIGNHSWDHAQLSKLSMSEVNKEIEDTTNIVKKLTGYTVTLVRPPYGSISDEMRKKLKYPMIIWNVETTDWKINTEDISEEEKENKILKIIKKNVQDGSIILMHDIHETSCEAAKIIIPWLQEHDYDVLSVSELMQRKGIDMKNGKVYASAY